MSFRPIRFYFTLPMLVSGFIAVLVGYTSSAAIIVQAAQAAGASPAETGSWLAALGFAMGISTLGLSLWTRMPVLTAWSTPGAALLLTSLHGVTLNEAVGIFVFSNALIVLCGVTGMFARLMRIVPPSLASAMLAGILLRFGLETFAGLQSNFLLCGSMCLVWLICRRAAARYAIIFALITGLAVAFMQHAIRVPAHYAVFAAPQGIMPHFSLSALIGTGLPFFLVTMASQNAPGIATLQAHGYRPPVSSLISWTGIVALMLSPFGGFSVCIAAITAAICMGDDVDSDPQRRWMASTLAGVFYLLAGASGAVIGLLFIALPVAMTGTLAGLALLNTLSGSMQRMLAQPAERDAALIAFLITASNLSLAGVGSAFWGLTGGLLAHLILTRSAT